MRRSIVFTMSLGLLALSTPLQAQSTSAWTGGLSATLGGSWQYEGVDLGVVRPAVIGPMRHYSVVARIGSFIDEAAILGGARGFVGGLAFGVRTAPLTLAEVGQELNLNQFGVDLTIEAAGYAASNSPLPEGSSWLSAAVLPGIRYGRPGAMQVALTVGPAAFIGRSTKVRAFFDLRLEFPLAPR